MYHYVYSTIRSVDKMHFFPQIHYYNMKKGAKKLAGMLDELSITTKASLFESPILSGFNFP